PHWRLLYPPQIRRARPLARRMAIHAARMLQDLARFLEQRDGPRLGIGNPSEALRRTQFGRQLRPIGCRRLTGGPLDRGASDNHEHCPGAVQDGGFAHHTKPRTIGSWRGRLWPRRASALPTAGPIGGTTGLPTPVGFSLERKIVTSTSGISWMRSER